MLRSFIVPLVFFVMYCSSAGAYEGADLSRWLLHAESLLSGADGYTAIFHKQERIQNKLTANETIFLKFRKPFQVYMKWVIDPYKGREALYVEGCNNNLIKVREHGFAGLMTLNLDPKGALIMKGSRHPVTDSGLANLVKLIRTNVEMGTRAGEIELLELGVERVYGRATEKIEIIFPRGASGRYYCRRAVINVDMENKIPVRTLIFDWNDLLVENYGYEAIKLDAALTDADFDPENPAYRF